MRVIALCNFNGFGLCIDSAYACQSTRTTAFDETI